MVTPDFAVFAKEYNAGNPIAVKTTLVGDLLTPVAAFLKLRQPKNGAAFLFESVEGGAARGRYSMIGLEPDLIWKCQNGQAAINRNALIDKTSFENHEAKALESLRAVLAESALPLGEDYPPMAAGLFGYLGYDMVRQMERLPYPNKDILQVPDSILIRPTIMMVFDSVLDQISLVTPVRPDQKLNAEKAYDLAIERLQQVEIALEQSISITDRADQDISVSDPVSNTTPEEYADMVARAKEYVRAGDVFQVVLSQRFETDFPLPPFALYRALRRTNPAPFLGYLDLEDFQIVCSSPEILVRVRDGKVSIRPIAGTRPRGKTAAEDKAHAESLLADPKERSEHLMLLDLGRNDVGRVSEIGSVKVTDSFFLEYYSQVMHIVSNVEGDLDVKKYDALDALQAGFPAGTVSGAPKVRAMEIIDELEKEKRGVYAGCIGYFSADGEMDTCIVLRTALVKNGRMYVQAGAGIVYDSDPASEQQECINKAKALFKAAEEAVHFASRSHFGQ
ncbi:anthranilate synthase component I [Microvirga sp. W0021]|uniref:Anthranilate synthase component 1 n=1 Tax=Hohaiivirga grylli TaxID=3133970 RepID=A0ABV0BJD8_9HYPH